MRLSILICHLPKRKAFFDRLMANLNNQIHFDQQDYWTSGGRAWIDGEMIDVIWDSREKISIGEKRNDLIREAVKFQTQCNYVKNNGYVSFIDDDDNVSRDYVELLLRGIATGPDCCSLTGIITEDGLNPQIFQHSIKYKEYKTQPDQPPGIADYEYSNWRDKNAVDYYNGKIIKYLRYPNHLNCIKTLIAAQFKFPELNHGEDTDWATQIFKSGLLKTEHWIEKPIYFYEWRSKK